MTREEAIRRIKAWNLDPDDMEALSVVIPEFAESEDERIRKALIDEIKVWDEDYKLFKHVSKEKVLAYLKKQKEQKPAEWSEEDDRNLSFMIECMEGCSNGEKLFFPRSTALKYVEWLKSLRNRPTKSDT